MTAHRFILTVESRLDQQQVVDRIYLELGHYFALSQMQLLDGNYQRIEPTPDDGPQKKMTVAQSPGLLVDEIVPDA